MPVFVPDMQKNKYNCLERRDRPLPDTAMHVFARLDHAGRPATADRTAGRLGPLGYKPLPLSSQSVYSTEDILSLLEPHSGGDGYIDTLFLEFENEQIPIWYVPTSYRFENGRSPFGMYEPCE